MTLPWHSLTPFLRAVAADPGDETARLAFADWLEENNEQERCEACEIVEASGYSHTDFLSHATGECYRCGSPNGTVGWTPGVCQRWAMYIRESIELERTRDNADPKRGVYFIGGQGHYAETTERKTWTVRKAACDALLPDLAPVLMRGPVCERCGGRGEVLARPKRADQVHRSWKMCRSCNSLGGTGPLARLSPDAVTFRRGFPHRVRVERLEQVCRGGQPTEWAKEIVSAWPIESIEAGDRPAYQSEMSNRWLCCGGRDRNGTGHDELGGELFSEYYRHWEASLDADGMNTPALATTALATAVATLTRAAAAKPSAAETVA